MRAIDIPPYELPFAGVVSFVLWSLQVKFSIPGLDPHLQSLIDALVDLFGLNTGYVLVDVYTPAIRRALSFSNSRLTAVLPALEHFFKFLVTLAGVLGTTSKFAECAQGQVELGIIIALLMFVLERAHSIGEPREMTLELIDSEFNWVEIGLELIADTIMKYGMTILGSANEFAEACDLYTEVQALGMEPDAVMYGSLMKFAVKAGRTALAQEIFDRTEGGGSVQAYMWLIRAAGQEKDVGRAVGIFRRLQRAQPELVDAMAFNITLDACISNQDVQAANELLEEMRQKHSLNLVTYNTLIKGHAGA